jgi:hypothetical protein
LDGDEVLALVLSAIGTLAFILTWYPGLFTVAMLAGGCFGRVVLALVPISCLAGLQFFLTHYAAHEVRQQGEYDVLFLAGGAAWLSLTNLFIRLAGLSVRDDAIEARNTAVAIVACGALIGMTACYAGANVGEGPTIWTTFVPAFMAGGVILVLWLLITKCTGLHDAIAIDRDAASGLRLAGFLVAAGVVLGCAVAGDWHSWAGTLQDFEAIGWPVLVLALATAFMHALWKPSIKQPNRDVLALGALPAMCLVIGALGWAIVSTHVLHMGGH